MKAFKLDDEPKITSGFKVPEAYFDDLQSKVNQRLQEDETPVISLFAQRKTWIMAIAAVFIIALTIPLIHYMNRSSTEIDKGTLENYLTNHADISDDDIVELFNENDIQKMKVDLKIDDKELEDILTADGNVEDYIVD
ncbi:hypothetical protein [Flavobacterium sp.]|uniref:hypothetical protein n=1 Tax=Flavobacterium sp. TaxID=239 RepID=UPI00262FB33C|nr:hypothetical protein [Flavobacterium sp.]